MIAGRLVVRGRAFVIDNFAIIISCALVLFIAVRAAALDQQEQQAERAARRAARLGDRDPGTPG